MYFSHYGLKRKPLEISPDRVFFGRGKDGRVVIRVVASTQGRSDRMLKTVPQAVIRCCVALVNAHMESAGSWKHGPGLNFF